ncbi:MAG TPA: diacylglycerol kinase family lipid kinase [Erysipelotrichaceae bacterium]|jgi:YegS/Rv2252/BmrU family lipid kinase|nr:diacylglycerol kinase family lipid kinase [Erysipelotrichaceae bacterium]HQB32128.1 diacylglycerol kinase family lipid kinase [Erysipelotrichaceae bacterium]
MKILFVYNPVAGQLQIKNHLWSIINYFCSGDIELTVHATQENKDAYKVVKKQAGKYDKIICCGGDGTLHEVVNGMMETGSSRVLGFIPAGSVNDFATSLNLPRNMEQAARLAMEGQPKSIDIGKFNDEYFTYVAAFGVFTDIGYITTQEMKNLLGRLAYFFQGVKSVALMKTYRVKIRHGNEEFEDEYIYGMVSNTVLVGSLYKMPNQDVQLDDGLFEVTLIKAPNDLIELGSIGPYLLTGKGDNDLVKIFKTNSIEVIIDEQIPWTLDGEYGGNPKTVKIEVIEKALNLIYQE